MIALPRLVGINGLKRVGKDTIADYLVKNHGYTKVSFATPVYEAIYRLSPWVYDSDMFGWIQLGELVDYKGWEYAKTAIPEVRRLLEYMGTEVGREMFGENFWVDQAFRNLEDKKRYVFPDVRFENEMSAIASHRPDAFLLKVTRPGTKPNGHASDRHHPDNWFDAVIVNDDTVEALCETALDKLGAGR